MRAVTQRRQRINELLQKKHQLTQDLLRSKMASDSSLLNSKSLDHSFVLRSFRFFARSWRHVSGFPSNQADRDDPDFLEALERETEMLSRRVYAGKIEAAAATWSLTSKRYDLDLFLFNEAIAKKKPDKTKAVIDSQLDFDGMCQGHVWRHILTL